MKIEIDFVFVEDSIGKVRKWKWLIRSGNQKTLAQSPVYYRNLTEVSRCLHALLDGGPHESAVESALQQARLKTTVSCRGEPQH